MKIVSVIAAILLILSNAYGQPLVARNIDFPGGSTWFYEYKPPHFNNVDLFPLIICLHGGGEGGDTPAELFRVKEAGLPKLIDQGGSMEFNWHGKTEGFVVLAPQAHRDEVGYWPVRYVNNMIDYGIANLRVDPARIFVVGYSDGGNGTWWYGTQSGTGIRRIAGLVPAAPTIVNGPYCNIADNRVAVWAFHGGGDNEDQTINAVNAVNDRSLCPEGTAASFIPAVDTVYAFGGHDIYTSRVFDTSNANHYPNIFQWMLSVRRDNDPTTNQPPVPVIKNGPAINLTAPVKLKDFPVLDGSASMDDDIIMDYLWEQVGGPVSLLPSSSANIETEKIRQYPTVAIHPPSDIVAGAEVGIYQFRLRVKDYLTTLPGHTQFANLTVDVQMPPSGHAAPAVFAGTSHLLSPEEPIWVVEGKYKLYGSVLGNTPFNWRFISGPAQPTLQESHGAGAYPGNDPNIRFGNMDVPGTYLFEFSVLNNYGESGLDTLALTRTSLAALPVSYESFTGSTTNHTNILNWVTQNEKNNVRFDIQRSIDGVSFKVIGTVQATDKPGSQHYRFEDGNSSNAITYYRLSQVDKDGHSNLSKTIIISSQQGNLFVSQYPNPVHDVLSLSMSSPAVNTVQVIIADMEGRILAKYDWRKDAPVLKKSINCAGLKPGMYQLTVSAGAERKVSSFVKY